MADRSDRSEAGAAAEPDGRGLGLRLTGVSLERDLALAGQGWRRRFVGGPPKLEEVIELYASIGHDVRTEPLDDADLGHDCQGCALALSVFCIVYTRERT